MKDVLGAELNVGDFVGFTIYEESRMNIGRIVSFTVKKAKIEPVLLRDPQNKRADKTLAKPLVMRSSDQMLKVEQPVAELTKLPSEWVSGLLRS